MTFVILITGIGYVTLFSTGICVLEFAKKILIKKTLNFNQ